VEDLFDESKDRWQKSYRYPLYLRFLWVVGVGIAAAAYVLRGRLWNIVEGDPRIGWAVVAVIGLAVLWTFWKSLKAWESRIVVSPTSLKAWYLLRSRERVSWDSMDRLVGKWRLIGHTLTLFGTDGARIRMRSNISRYGEILAFIRAKAPAHIVKELDEFLSDEEEPEEQDQEPEPEEPGGESEEPEEKKEDAAQA